MGCIHLRGLLAQERDVHFCEVGGHHHLALHLLRRLVQDRLPERHEQLALVVDARLHYGPYFAAQDFGRDKGISPEITALSTDVRYSAKCPLT